MCHDITTMLVKRALKGPVPVGVRVFARKFQDDCKPSILPCWNVPKRSNSPETTKTHGSMQYTFKNHQIQWYLLLSNSGLYRISMEFRLSHAILRPNGRLLSHSSRLLSHYRTKSTKNIKFRTIPAQNTKNYQNRFNNQKVTAI